jgi:hypothetical protein
MRSLLLCALAFGVVAAATRASLPTTHTRYQLAVFLALAGLFEMAGRRRLAGSPPRLVGFLLNVMAIVLAMAAVKFAIDGTFHKAAWLRRTLSTIDRRL